MYINYIKIEKFFSVETIIFRFDKVLYDPWGNIIGLKSILGIHKNCCKMMFDMMDSAIVLGFNKNSTFKFFNFFSHRTLNAF